MTDLDHDVTDTQLSDRRALLRKLTIGGGAAAIGAVALSQQASAGDSEGVETGGTALELGDAYTNTADSPTTVTWSTADPLTDTSMLSVGQDPPSDVDGNNVFPAAVGGYAKDMIANGVHGSTVSADGVGVVAANLAVAQDVDAETPGPAAAALLVASAGGPQIKFLGLPDAVVGPTTGTHSPGELYVDAERTLWFTVPVPVDPDAPVTDPPTEPGVRFLKLAGTPTAGSLHMLPFPERVRDTRVGDDPVKPAADSTTTVDLTKLVDETDSGLPAGATAALLTVTVAQTEGRNFLSVAASGVELPEDAEFSSSNWNEAGIAFGASVTSAVSAEGAIDIILGPGAATHLVVDVVGFYL